MRAMLLQIVVSTRILTYCDHSVSLCVCPPVGKKAHERIDGRRPNLVDMGKG